MWRSVYRQRWAFNNSFPGEKNMTLHINCKRICKQKLKSSLIKALLEKLINSVLFGSGRRPTWSWRHCSVQWPRAVALSQHALKAALHIVNIERTFIVQVLAQTFIIVMQVSCAFYLVTCHGYKRHLQTCSDKSNVKCLRRDSIRPTQYNSTNRPVYVHSAKW